MPQASRAAGSRPPGPVATWGHRRRARDRPATGRPARPGVATIASQIRHGVREARERADSVPRACVLAFRSGRSGRRRRSHAPIGTHLHRHIGASPQRGDVLRRARMTKAAALLLAGSLALAACASDEEPSGGGTASGGGGTPRSSRSVWPTTPAAAVTARSTTPPSPASRPPSRSSAASIQEVSPNDDGSDRAELLSQPGRAGLQPGHRRRLRLRRDHRRGRRRLPGHHLRAGRRLELRRRQG